MEHPQITDAIVTDLDDTLVEWITIYVPPFVTQKPFPGAAEAMRRWSAKGSRVLYLSGKAWWGWPFQKLWLWRWGFPTGPSWTIGHTSWTKADIIRRYQGKNWRFATGYSEDEVAEAAYKETGVPYTRVPYPYKTGWWNEVS